MHDARAVHAGSVSAVPRRLGKQPLSAQHAVVVVEGIDPALGRIVVVERASVGTHRRPVGHAVAVVMARDLTASIAIQRPGNRRLAVVHRAEPQAAIGGYKAIVQPVLRTVRLDLGQHREAASRGIEPVKPRPNATDQRPVLGRQGKAGLIRCVPRLTRPVRHAIAMQLASLDVDEPDAVVPRRPHRTFAQLGSDIPDQFRR